MERYLVQGELGSGGFARVLLATFRRPKHEVAIKVIPKASDDPDHARDVRREISIMESIDHPFICRIYDHFDDESSVYLVIERLGESLLDRVNRSGPLSESDARIYFCQMLSAISYLHGRGVCHRDLKMENLLFDRHGNLRVIDFGLSIFFDRDLPLMRTMCGCASYAPPEMLKEERYTPKADVWSAGVVLFAMVAGRLPFADENAKALVEKILNTEPEYPSDMSAELRDLIGRMLCKDGIARIGVDEIAAHPWIAGMTGVTYAEIRAVPDVDERALAQVEKARFEREDVEKDGNSEAKVAFRIMKRYLETDEIEKVCGTPLHREVDGRTAKRSCQPTVLYRSDNQASQFQRKQVSRQMGVNMRGKKYNTVAAKAKDMDGIAQDGKVRRVSDLNG